MADRQEHLLRALISVTGRQAFPPDRLAELIAPNRMKNDKRVRAFNLCDGTRTQADISKQLKLDNGNFSRTVARWVTSGIVFKVAEGHQEFLLHVYPLGPNTKPKGQ